MTSDQTEETHFQQAIPAVLISATDGNFVREHYREEDVTLFAFQEYRYDPESRSIGSEIHTATILNDVLQMTFPNLSTSMLNEFVMQKIQELHPKPKNP